MDYQNKKDKLDYSQVVFRQLDRVNMLLCNTNTGGYRSVAINDSFSALNALESLVIYRLSDEIRKEYYEKKEKYRINNMSLDYGAGPHFKTNFIWYNLLMNAINQSNLLPAKRESFETGDD